MLIQKQRDLPERLLRFWRAGASWLSSPWVSLFSGIAGVLPARSYLPRPVSPERWDAALLEERAGKVSP
jgi:hypothetical protein